MKAKHGKFRGAGYIEPLESRRLLTLTAAGAQFEVNGAVIGDQYAPAIAANAAGAFVVVWTSDGQDGSGTGVYAQRYSATGAAQGAEFRVNTITTGAQYQPKVAMDSAGDFVIAWSSESVPGGSGTDVVARRFNALGSALDTSEFLVNSTTVDRQEAPSIALTAAGGFVIAWDSNLQDGSSYGVYARTYNAAGVAQSGEIQVAQTTADLQADPSVAVDSAGNFVVAWETGSTTGTSFYDIDARRFTAAGAAQGNEFLVNSESGAMADYQVFPSAAMDPAGDFVIGWSSYAQDGSGYGVYAKRYNSSGGALGASFRVNSYTAANQDDVAVAISAGGAFVITWASSGQDGSGDGVYLQSYDANGAAIGTETRVNTTTINDQNRPAIAVDPDGDAIVAWQDGGSGFGVNGQDGSGYGVFAQRFGHPPAVTTSSFNYLSGQSIVFTFSENVSASFSTADLALTNLTTGATIAAANLALSYNSATNSATVIYTGNSANILPDGNYTATLSGTGITDASGNALDGDADGFPGGNYTLSFFVLAGDANRDRVVNVADLGILASNWQMSGRTFAQGDFDHSGTVDVSDLGILATNWQKSLPAPASFSSNAVQKIPPRTVAPAKVAARKKNSRLASQVLT